VTLTFEGLAVRGWSGGSGFPILLLHGSGPGASSIGNWRPVLDGLAGRYRVLAFDLVGFGESERKPVPPYFDFDLWRRQARFGVDALGADRVGIVGHSISGALALNLAADDSRIVKIMTTGTMGTDMRANPHLSLVWRCPRNRTEMRRAAETLIHDPSLITESYLDARMQIIGSPAYQRYFDTMFDGEFERYIRAAEIPEERLATINADIAMLHGRHDLAFPAEETSIRMAAGLRNADLTLLARCSHSVAMERTDAFLLAAQALFG
jgi:2-hydroxymuconate-semialdehyde hydrolase